MKTVNCDPFMAHWEPLLKMVSLVKPPHLKKAILKWINQNQNCAYSVKTGACTMNCESCANDITIERIMSITVTRKENENAKKNLPKV